ncbi:hypothetical protein VFPBJ_05723 [Purpureocillium lilacinum]|uniref:Uncharacterized protein n=1 Tax=Purpureocillium lilacinum TaxID=33203 RepID=A0A179GRK3_PURLI|nr:hypothetical protein VFPBJ_05723 [Purpureocillium lilacinum]
MSRRVSSPCVAGPGRASREQGCSCLLRLSTSRRDGPTVSLKAGRDSIDRRRRDGLSCTYARCLRQGRVSPQRRGCGCGPGSRRRRAGGRTVEEANGNGAQHQQSWNGGAGSRALVCLGWLDKESWRADGWLDNWRRDVRKRSPALRAKGRARRLAGAAAAAGAADSVAQGTES